MIIRISLVVGISLIFGINRLDAVMFADTADITHNSSTPGDNSGWQYEGKFMTFLGVPIAPYFFITAKHFGGAVGTVFDFHGDSYTTIGFQDTTSTDLRIWEVNHAKPFPVYAPLSSGVADVGATATVYGRGTQRGAALAVSGESKGWLWGPGDDVERWGKNVVEGSYYDGPAYGNLLYCRFNKPGVTDECHLSTGDSGGGLFVLESGLWRLAGINLSVDGPFRTSPGGADLYGSFYDVGGLYYNNGMTLIPERVTNIPSNFYCSRISTSLAWISGIASEVNTLAPEDFSAWQRLYFTPAQIATPATTGSLADFDNDGISNLLEFALNLDPTYNERATMAPATGLRGLPLVRVENISGADHVTIEYVRRAAGSGSGLTYTPQFSSDLNTWVTTGTVTVTTINPRWEGVKIVDASTTVGTPKRFARVKVSN